MRLVAAVLLASAAAVYAADETPPPPPPLTITRAAGPITIDGDLSDPGWRGAATIDQRQEAVGNRVNVWTLCSHL